MALVLAVAALTAALPATASATTGSPVPSPSPTPEPATTCARPAAVALGLDTDLRAPSAVTAWAIDVFLATSTSLPPLGAVFKQAERTSGVNALYLVAHAMLETDFGRSYIAQTFHNLFGWTAYDRDPVRFATQFPDFEIGIAYVADRIAAGYLREGGAFHGGSPTLRGMYRYASDPRWAESIVRIANSICLPAPAATASFTTSLATERLHPGEATEVTIATAAAGFPDGLQLAARVRLENADPAASADPTPFGLTGVVSAGGVLRLPVQAGFRSGRFVLDFQLLDSDGWPLPPSAAVAIPSVTLEVVARHAILEPLDAAGPTLSPAPSAPPVVVPN